MGGWDVRLFLAVQCLLALGHVLTTDPVTAAVLAMLVGVLSSAAALAWALRSVAERRSRLGCATALLLVTLAIALSTWGVAGTETAPARVLPTLLLHSGLVVLAASVLRAVAVAGRLTWDMLLDTVALLTGPVVLCLHLDLVPFPADTGDGTLAGALLALTGVLACWLLRSGRDSNSGALLLAGACALWFVTTLAWGPWQGVTSTGPAAPGLAWYVPCVMVALTCRAGFGTDVGREPSRASRRTTVVGGVALAGPLGLLVADATGARVAAEALGLATLVPMTALLLRSVGQFRALEHQASHDPLTGLLNRQAFADRSEMLLGRGEAGSMVVIDLDGFKRINDDFGHEVGDAVLRAVAHRLTAVAPRESLLARRGGDEFAMLLPPLSGVDVEVITRVLDMPVACGTTRLGGITASIGIIDVDSDPQVPDDRSPHDRSPHDRDPHQHSPHDRDPHEHSPHQHSPGDAPEGASGRGTPVAALVAHPQVAPLSPDDRRRPVGERRSALQRRTGADRRASTLARTGDPAKDRRAVTEELDRLLRAADAAMYREKGRPKRLTTSGERTPHTGIAISAATSRPSGRSRPVPPPETRAPSEGRTSSETRDPSSGGVRPPFVASPRTPHGVPVHRPGRGSPSSSPVGSSAPAAPAASSSPASPVGSGASPPTRGALLSPGLPRGVSDSSRGAAAPTGPVESSARASHGWPAPASARTLTGASSSPHHPDPSDAVGDRNAPRARAGSGGTASSLHAPVGFASGPRDTFGPSSPCALNPPGPPARDLAGDTAPAGQQGAFRAEVVTPVPPTWP